MDLFDVVCKFQLTNLSQDWVDTQWRQDFSSDKELPSDYAFALDEVDYGDLLNELCYSLKEWCTTADSSFDASLDSTNPSGSNQLNVSTRPDRRSWQTLLNSDVNHKALVAVVSSFLKADVKELTDDVSRRLALAASRAYFMLLSVRGSQIFNVYNSILFVQAIESLKVLNLLGDNQEKPKQAKPKGRKKKNTQEMDEEPPEIDDTDVVHISNAEKAEIIKTLILALDDLEFCLSVLSLKGEDDALSITITALVSIARLEKSCANFVVHCPRSTNVTFLSHKAYQTLLSLCHSRQGDVSEIIRTIGRSLLHHLVMSAQEMHTSDKTKNTIRAHMILFIKLIVEKHGEVAFSGIQALVQQLCVRTPDKADIRARCVQQILMLLSHFPLELFTKCSLWMCSLMYSDTVKHRVMALEIVTKLLNADEKSGEETILPTRVAAGSSNPSVSEDRPQSPSSSSENEEEPRPGPSSAPDPEILENGKSTTLFVCHKFFLSALLSRMGDMSPTVRAKCLSSFASLIMLKHQVMQDIMKSLFISPYSHLRNPISAVFEEERAEFDFRLFFLRKNKEPPNRNPLPGGTRIVEKVQNLTLDQKVFVRKSALNVLCNICRLNSQWVTTERIEIMVQSCSDLSVTVRKMMIQCMTDLLLDYPTNDLLVKAWVQGVLPLVADNEIKCQEKAIEAVGTVVLGNLVAHHLVANNLHFIPWRVIKLLPIYEMRSVFKFVCRHWITTKRIGTKEMKILSSHVGTVNDLGAWNFIVCLSEYADFHQPEMIVQYYLDNIHGKSGVREYLAQLVVEALFLNWRHVDPDVMDDLVKNKLMPSLEQCVLPLPFITPIMNICIQYNGEAVTEFAKRIISRCDNYLKRSIGPNSPAKLTREVALTQHIFTLGEAASVCPGHRSQETVHLLCCLIDDCFLSENGKWPGKVGSTCKAVTVATLGKFCLQDQMLAKKLVPVLGTLLDAVTPPEVKLNTLTTMTDLCVRYTSIVESYLGDMCVCLKDSDVRVRRKTLELMIGLIQEDYVKLKCPYFYYILHMLQDPEPRIRNSTKAFIINTVLKKNPRIMVQEFIQALYFLNDYEACDAVGLAFTKVSMNPNEKKAFMISGCANKAQRRDLLRFMIENMTDDHKFKTLTSICGEIFEGVCEDKILLNTKGLPLVSDAIFVLGCEELRINTSKNKADDEDEEFGAADKVDNGVMLLVDELLKRLYQESVMPSIIKLKRKLQEMKSSLLRELMISLRYMMKEFKDWMQEILSADPTLASEIDLDMRILDDEAEEAEEEPTRGLPTLPKIMNDSEKLIDSTVTLPRLSLTVFQANGTALKSPRQSVSSCDVSTREVVLTPPPVPSVISDDDVSSLSTPSQSSQTSKASSKGTSRKGPRVSPNSVVSPISTTPIVNVKKRQLSHSSSSTESSPRRSESSNSPIPGRMSDTSQPGETSDFSPQPAQSESPSPQPSTSKNVKKKKSSAPASKQVSKNSRKTRGRKKAKAE